MFTGDLGAGMPIIPDPVVPPGADVLIMESTYGNRSHVPVTRYATATAGGDPPCHPARRQSDHSRVQRWSHAGDRLQLRQIWNSGEIRSVPVFVDSPLSVNVTEVFRQSPGGLYPTCATCC